MSYSLVSRRYGYTEMFGHLPVSGKELELKLSKKRVMPQALSSGI